MNGKMQRMGMVIGVRPETLDTYAGLHAAPWPAMNALLSAANISNYSIYLRRPENLLFGYWEYTGSDFGADMAVLGSAEVCKRWLALTDPCQLPLPTAKPGEWWCYMDEVFHLD